MKGIWEVFIGIIALFLLIGPFQEPITDGIKGWRTINTTESSVVATAGGVTTANITLGHDLFLAATGQVISVTSNITESPVASSYTEATKVLLISALDAGTSRTISVNYYAETDDTVMRALGPFLSLLIFGGCAFAILWGIWRQSKSGGRRRGR